MEHIEIIDRYLKGALKGNELRDFLNMLEENEELRRELDFIKNMSRVIQEEEKEELKVHFQGLEEGMENTAKVPTMKKWKWMIAIIALSIVLYFIFKPDSDPKPSQLFAAYFRPYPNTYQPVTRGGASDLLTRTFISYEQGDYISSVVRFDSLLEQSTDNAYLFYRGMSYLANDVYTYAIQDFNSITGGEYFQESRFYLGLTFIAIAQYDDAYSNFEKILPDDYGYSDAREIMQKIK